MARLPKPFCRHAVEIQAMLDEGREGEARARLTQLLREGKAGPEVQLIVEGLLNPIPNRKLGPKRKKRPFKWVEIGRDYEELRDAGMTADGAYEQLAKRYPRSESVIEKTVRYFREALQKSD
jgi:hypothetical protein